LFIASPKTSEAASKKIMDILDKSCGKGGYHYVLPITSDMDDLV